MSGRGCPRGLGRGTEAASAAPRTAAPLPLESPFLGLASRPPVTCPSPTSFWKRLSRLMSKVNPEPNVIHIMGCYILGNPNGEKVQ